MRRLVVSVLCVVLGVVWASDTIDAPGLESKLEKITQDIAQSNNAWYKQYTNIKAYESLLQEIGRTQNELERLESIEDKGSRVASQILQYKNTLQTLQRQRDILESYAKNYSQLLELPEIKDVPHVSNPILIISGYSFIKALQENQHTIENNARSLQEILDIAKQRYEIAQILNDYYIDEKIAPKAKEYQIQSIEALQMVQSLESAQQILKTSYGIYTKETESVIATLESEIKEQIIKMISILVAIGAIFIIGLFTKIALRKYILDSNRVYTANKIINIFNLSLIVIILLFSYLENVSYLVAILGFASAGLAIAMKDLFMSVLGWFVIVLGGSIHVGDRVRVVKDGAVYVGDVLDISVLRMTIYEDITLTSYMENRRAGRIIFIPNNYIFTTLLANYTHAGLKTVWDGIDISITFDSNYKKALSIATEIGKKYSKGYTEVTRKRMERLKDRFSLRNINLETRAFCMLEPNGIRISLWYHVNSYAIMTLRSTISGELIEAFLREEDIHIAYPTTKVVPTGGDGRGNKPFIEPQPLGVNMTNTHTSVSLSSTSAPNTPSNTAPGRPRGGGDTPFVDNKDLDHGHFPIS